MKPASQPEPSGTSGQFTTTHWSVVVAAGRRDSPDAAAALENLCRTYWYPLYVYVRRRGYEAPDAEDLTQELFARLLEKDFPAGITPDGGRFRSYLLTALNHFLVNEWKSRQAGKRGGGKRLLSWDELGAEDRYRLEPSEQMTPEKLFERRWASALLDQVRQRLQTEYAAQGKTQLYERLRPCLTGAEHLLPYAELAALLGLSESGVKMAVQRLRRRYGEMLRLEIAQTVSGPEEIEEELRGLIANRADSRGTRAACAPQTDL
ncbi:MAG: RNA polymerase subunit sigma-24 [Verrucomicrobia bacterium]|nr:MAG: RNA polymerase subunit sigma-24 [Verrucomicrobiota bacterium]